MLEFVISVRYLNLTCLVLASRKDVFIDSMPMANGGRVQSMQVSIRFFVVEKNCNSLLITFSAPYNTSVLSATSAGVVDTDNNEKVKYKYISTLFKNRKNYMKKSKFSILLVNTHLVNLRTARLHSTLQQINFMTLPWGFQCGEIWSGLPK